MEIECCIEKIAVDVQYNYGNYKYRKEEINIYLAKPRRQHVMYFYGINE